MRACIQFLTATLIFIDQIITIIYFATNNCYFANLSIRRAIIASILITPILNLAFSLYYLYPNHEEVFSKHTNLFRSYIKEILVTDINQFHKDFFQFRKKGSQFYIALKTLLIYIMFIPAMMIFLTFSVIKMIFVLLNFLYSMGEEFSAMLAYGAYLAFFFWFRIMNCMNITVVIECMGSSKYRFLDSSSKMKFFGLFMDGLQAIFQAFPAIIVKSINLSELNKWDIFSIVSIGFDILDILFQIINASLYKINRETDIEHNNADITI